MKHKHFDLIVAWAEGESIDHFLDGKWWPMDTEYPPIRLDKEYRIHPKKVVRQFFWQHGKWYSGCSSEPGINIIVYFDGDTDKIQRVEVP